MVMAKNSAEKRRDSPAHPGRTKDIVQLSQTLMELSKNLSQTDILPQKRDGGRRGHSVSVSTDFT
jgi:hypothetical protein